MTGQNIVDKFRDLIDDSPSDDLCLQLLNIVKDLVESDRPWRMLIKEDSSNTFGSGENYLTAKSLPSDFLYETKVVLGDTTDDSFIEYDPIAFEERRRFKDSQRYYIDLANSNMYVCGSVSRTETIYLYYIYETDEIILATSPVWPTKFQRLIPLLMAEIHKAGIDADIFNIQQALALSKPGQLLWKAMVNWDSALKLRTMNNQTPISGSRDGRITSGIVNDPDNLL